MDCAREEELIYRKSKPSEVIKKGDVIMLDVEKDAITKAVMEKEGSYSLNSRLIIGVCTESDNDSPISSLINAGPSKIHERKLLHGGKADSTNKSLVLGGKSEPNPREVISLAYSGRHVVNISGYISLGDKITISRFAGKAKAKDFLDRNYYNTRSIGKVIKFTDNKKQALVLLNIE